MFVVEILFQDHLHNQVLVSIAYTLECDGLRQSEDCYCTLTLPSTPSWDSGEHAGLCSVQKTHDEKGFHVRITGWKCAVDEEHAHC